MSKKIISTCPQCNKGCMMVISNPIVFHSELTQEDYTVKDLKNCVILQEDQKKYIQAYIKEESECETE